MNHVSLYILPFFPEPKTFGSADGWPAEGRPAGGGARCIESGDDGSEVDGSAIFDCVTAMASTEPI